MHHIPTNKMVPSWLSMTTAFFVHNFFVSRKADATLIADSVYCEICDLSFFDSQSYHLNEHLVFKSVLETVTIGRLGLGYYDYGI